MTTKITIRGDWLVDGYIDNLGRRPELMIAIYDGVACDDCDDFPALIGEMPLRVTIDGELMAWGSSVAFLPAAGELKCCARCGINIPIAKRKVSASIKTPQPQR